MDRNPRSSAESAGLNDYVRSYSSSFLTRRMKMAGRVRETHRQLRMYARQLFGATENFRKIQRGKSGGGGAKVCRIVGLCSYTRKNPPNVQNPAPSIFRQMSEERRKPIPSGRKGIIEIYANFLPRFFNLQRSRPAVNVIQASVRKQAEATVGRKQNQ